MSYPLPTFQVPKAPQHWPREANPLVWDWQGVPPLSPFMLADGQAHATQQTVTRLCFDEVGLYVRFDCEDDDIWGTFTHRNDPIYDEEVVEVFLAPGKADPIDYHEFEVSPNGVLFAAKVNNPTSQRVNLTIDLDMPYEGLYCVAKRQDTEHRWSAVIIIPWASLAITGDIPEIWRANFYRIERPRAGKDEYSCWSPTIAQPADFHKPARFGTLIFKK